MYILVHNNNNIYYLYIAYILFMGGDISRLRSQIRDTNDQITQDTLSKNKHQRCTGRVDRPYVQFPETGFL